MMSARNSLLIPALQAVCAAALFGASAPLIKYALGSVEPVPLAGLLYLGSGTGLSVLALVTKKSPGSRPTEAALRATDMPWVVGAILAGGIAAPILLMFSLKVTQAATASLLLNFEGAATTAIAALMFREATGLRVWGAVALMTVACVVLSWDPAGQVSLSPGALGVLGACALWGLDNNLTRNVAAKDPMMIVLLKGLGAGIFSLAVAGLVGQTLPPVMLIAETLGVGFLGYGLSTVLFVRSMRGLGAARTSAVYGIAPFAGAGLSLLAFQEQPGIAFLIGLPLMLVAALLLVGEQHSHFHRHAPMSHEHRAVSDDHHPPGQKGETQSPRHDHGEIGHAHPHAPDIHHRHDHAAGSSEKSQRRR